MNNSETGLARLWSKLINVGKQFDRWGIDYSNLHHLPFYKEAGQSVGDAWGNPISKYGKRVDAAYPKNLCRLFVATLLHDSQHPLALNTGLILEAAKRDDTEFFISLGKVLAKRKARTLFTNDRNPTEPTVQDQIAIFWTNGLLWLMTDQAALDFFQCVLGETITPHAYKMARGRRLQLVKHPDAPIIGITPIPASKTSNISGSKKRPILELKLKRGWHVLDGGLSAPSR